MKNNKAATYGSVGPCHTQRLFGTTCSSLEYTARTQQALITRTHTHTHTHSHTHTYTNTHTTHTTHTHTHLVCI
jgi:hypothetical protein